MAGYTTTAKFKRAFGTDRAQATMPEYDAVESETRLENVINSVSAYIDSYLSEGGFVTPVVFADITDLEAKTRLEELLSDICIAIVAGRVLPVATRGANKGGEKNASWAQAWLERVATGRVLIWGLPVGTRSRLQVVGENEPALPSSLFDTYRMI